VKNTRIQARLTTWLALCVVLVVALAACGSDSKSATTTTKGSTPVVALTFGSKNFGGAVALSHAYGQYLQSKGYKITFKDSIGPTETTFPALQKGDIDLVGDFLATTLTYLKGSPTGNKTETYNLLKAALVGKGVVAVPPSDALDVNGFYVTKATAAKYKLKNLSDLTAVAPQLVFGGPPECATRPLCLGPTENSLYGLHFKEVKKLDVGGPITAKDLDDSTIQVGLLFTGSSVISNNIVLLKDDKGLQGADNGIVLINEKKNTASLDADLAAVTAKLDTAAYNKMAIEVQNDKVDPSTAAAEFLKNAGLVK
jgi:osmoprotectant transport system substrate-binding protein